MKSETIYDESSEMLLITLDIIIPERLIPKENNILIQMIIDHINRFPKFYKNNMKLYQTKKQERPVLNPCYIP